VNRYLTLAGLAVVLAAAAVLSFDALRGLALAVAIPKHLAWLLPVAVDAGAAVSCATWLGGRSIPREAARFAAGMTWCLIAVTVAGNAGQLGMHAHAVVPPWWVAVLVGTIPPAVVGATVHLLVLVTRRGTVEYAAAGKPPAPSPRPERVTTPAPRPATTAEPASKPEPLHAVGKGPSMSAQVREWIAAELDAGRDVTGADADQHFGLEGAARCGARALKKVLEERERQAV
jgi:hypothetical protein